MGESLKRVTSIKKKEGKKQTSLPKTQELTGLKRPRAGRGRTKPRNMFLAKKGGRNLNPYSAESALTSVRKMRTIREGKRPSKKRGDSKIQRRGAPSA